MSTIYQKGDILHNKNGSSYEVLAVVDSNKTLLRRLTDDYLLEAFGIYQHKDSNIEWDYSHAIGFPQNSEQAIERQIAELCPTFECINIEIIQSLVLVHLDGQFFGVYDIGIGKFIC